MAEKSLYAILDIEKTATEEEIKKAYKKQALLWHPDRNSNNIEEANTKFKEIAEAYSILSDPGKRKIYDLSGNPRVNLPIRRAPDISVEINVSLEELYTGVSKEIGFDKLVICKDCKGIGGTLNENSLCKECNGTGFKESIMQFGSLTMNQRIQCNKCGGSGRTFSASNICKCCWGERRIKKKTYLKCIIQPGMSSGDTIRFEGEAHEILGSTEEIIMPGSFFAIIKEIPHSQFTRINKNLLYGKTITLKEALCGTVFDLIHLDGKKITCSLNEITIPNFVKVIKNQGMPEPTGRGDLHIVFTITFPTSLTPDQKLNISKLL